jgi:putative transposase
LRELHRRILIYNMHKNSTKPKRKSLRLKGFDYSESGLYFITICIQNKSCLLGNITNDEVILNEAGKMIQFEWENLPHQYPYIRLHNYIVMPNHFHAIIEIINLEAKSEHKSSNVINHTPNTIDPLTIENKIASEAGIHKKEKIKNIGSIIGAFKSKTTVIYIEAVKNSGWQPFNHRLWQRNFWEHIIRTDKSYNRISEYILKNPENWEKDKFH